MAAKGDGARAVTAGDDQTAIVWDLDTGTPTAAWHGDAAMEATAWAEEKLIFVVGDDLGAVHILGLRALGASAGQTLHSAQQPVLATPLGDPPGINRDPATWKHWAGSASTQWRPHPQTRLGSQIEPSRVSCILPYLGRMYVSCRSGMTRTP